MVLPYNAPYLITNQRFSHVARILARCPEPMLRYWPYRQPIATVSPGESVIVETLDAFGNRVTGIDTPPSKVLSLPYVNPVTGPIFVEGAEKGDTLSVTIQEIIPARDFGVSAIIPEFGGVCGTALTSTLNEPLPERVWIHPLTSDGMDSHLKCNRLFQNISAGAR